MIFKIEIITKRGQDFLKVSLQPLDLGLGLPLFGLDIQQPAAKLVAGGAGRRQTVGQGLHLLLALAQEVLGTTDLFIGIGLRKLARLKAHLRRKLQKLRLQMTQIRVFAQMVQPRFHALELGRQAKHALAVRGMGMGIGARDVMHIHGKAAVAAFQPGNPQIGGQIEQQQEHQPR